METRTEKMLTADERRAIVERIIKHYGIESMADFARRLGISPQNVNSWRTRGTYNVELLAVTFPELSGDWLLTGEEPMLKADRRLPVAPDPTIAALGDIDTRRALEALLVEQKLTAKAQAQTDQLLSIMKMLASSMNKPTKDAE